MAPAEEAIALGLQQALTIDDALSVTRMGASAGVRLEYRGLSLFDLQEQRLLVVLAEEQHDPGVQSKAADAYNFACHVCILVMLERSGVRALESLDRAPYD